MFNSVQKQFINGGGEFDRKRTVSSLNSQQHYFPLSSPFSQTNQQYRSTGVTPYHFYQPKSKLGMLNQRIQTQKLRRDTIRRNSRSLIKKSDGYISDSNRSHRSKRSNHSRGSSDGKHYHHGSHYDSNMLQRPTGFVATQPIIKIENHGWNQPHHSHHSHKPQPAPIVRSKLPSIPLPRKLPYVSDASESSLSSHRQSEQIYYTQPHVHDQIDPVLQKYPSFKKPSIMEMKDPSQEVYYDAQSHRDPKYQAPIIPVTTSVTTDPFPQSKVNSCQNRYGNTLEDVVDRSSKTAKFLVGGLIFLVLMLMIYEIIR